MSAKDELVGGDGGEIGVAPTGKGGGGRSVPGEIFPPSEELGDDVGGGENFGPKPRGKVGGDERVVGVPVGVLVAKPDMSDWWRLGRPPLGEVR